MATTKLQVRNYSTDVVSHAHPHNQVVISLGGSLEMDVDGRGGRADAAHGAVITSDAQHSFAASPRGRFLVLDLPADRSERGALWDASTHSPFVLLSDGTRHLSQYLAHRLDRPTAGPSIETYAGGLMLEALADDLHAGDQATAVSRPLARAIRFVDAHFVEPISVRQIAAACGRSESRVQSLFREQLGMGPGAWLTQRRIQAAERLLATSTHPITDIAQRVGFQDPSAFARAFRRATGVSPRNYRAQCCTPIRGD